MVGAFPLAKISMLGIKQITKPVVKVVKDFAKSNPLFKKCLCVPAGQLVNYIEARSKLRMLKLPQPKRIRPLSVDQATELGANLISEVLVVAIGIVLIYYEISRSVQYKIKHCCKLNVYSILKTSEKGQEKTR